MVLETYHSHHLRFQRVRLKRAASNQILKKISLPANEELICTILKKHKSWLLTFLLPIHACKDTPPIPRLTYILRSKVVSICVRTNTGITAPALYVL